MKTLIRITIESTVAIISNIGQMQQRRDVQKNNESSLSSMLMKHGSSGLNFKHDNSFSINVRGKATQIFGYYVLSIDNVSLDSTD